MTAEVVPRHNLMIKVMNTDSSAYQLKSLTQLAAMDETQSTVSGPHDGNIFCFNEPISYVDF